MIDIREVIVVEGRDDTAAVRRATDAVTIETHGYGIREETWDVLQKAYESKGLIIFTDPDRAGELIRARLTERFPKAKQAFLDQSEATRDGDIGIENAAPEDIERALSKARGAADGAADDMACNPADGMARNPAGGMARNPADGAAGGAAGPDPVHPDPARVPFTMRDMDRWGLNGCAGASERRRALGIKLGIGFAGAKTFLRRLNHFGVTREEVEAGLKGLPLR